MYFVISKIIITKITAIKLLRKIGFFNILRKTNSNKFIRVWRPFTQYGFQCGTLLIRCYNWYTINLRPSRLLSAAIENTMNNRNSVSACKLPIMESQLHWKWRLFNQYKTPSMLTSTMHKNPSKLLNAWIVTNQKDKVGNSIANKGTHTLLRDDCNRKSSLVWNVNTGKLTKTDSVSLDIHFHLFVLKYMMLYMEIPTFFASYTPTSYLFRYYNLKSSYNMWNIV